jgi:hypothetical protein
VIVAAEAMDGQRLFAARSGISDGLCGLPTQHPRKNGRQLGDS